MTKDQKYNLTNDQEFLSWLKDKISNGYQNFIEIDELEQLITIIIKYYEINYPDYKIGNNSYLKDEQRLNILFSNLTENQIHLLKNIYRSEIMEYHNNNISIGLNIDNYNQKEDTWYHKKFFLFVDQTTGIVRPKDYYSAYLDKSDIQKIEKELLSIEQLFQIFKHKYYDDLGFIEMQKCIYNHKCDQELRDKVLNFVTLNLLYSKHTSRDNGYKRAQIFIDQFNKNLNLSLKEIDDIVKKDSIYKRKTLIKTK